MEHTNGKIIVISAPSGSGKTTLLKRVMQYFPELTFSVSATTRCKRNGEIDGSDYYFIDEETFLEKIDKDEFIEWEKFYDYYYGTYKLELERAKSERKNIVLEIDVKGALTIKSIYKDAFLIFIEPPSIDVLIDRLKNRRTESEEDLGKRIERAKMELSLKNKFDFIIINDDLELAFEKSIKVFNKILTKGE